MSLRFRAFRGILWVAFGVHSAKVVTLLSRLLLARLLAPEAFGLVAVTSVVINSIQVFQTIGLEQALVVRKDNTAKVTNSAFYMSVTLGIVLAAALAVLAPTIALLFNNTAMVPLLRIMALIPFTYSLGTVPSALLTRDLRFRTLAWPKIVSAAVFSLIAVPLALAGFGAWSLAWGTLAQSTVNALAVWLITGWRPGLQFDRTTAFELFAYGKHIVGASFGSFLQSNVDTIAVGKVLGMTAVGYYDLAFTLANAIPALVMSAISPILLPTYAQMQSQYTRIASSHLQLVKYLLLVLTPFALTVGLLAREGILVFYGAKWQAAIVPLQILCLYALIRQVTASNAAIFMVTHKIKEWNYIVYFNLAILVILAWPAVAFGHVVGMSVLMALIVSLIAVITFSFNGHTLGTSLARYGRLILLPLGAASVSTVILLALTSLPLLSITDYGAAQFLPNVIRLAVKGLVLMISYCAVVYALDAQVRTELTTLAPQAFKGSTFAALFHERG